MATVIVVAGDSDMVPALKFARREGLRVCLATMNHPVRRELRIHADLVMDVSPGLAQPCATPPMVTSSLAGPPTP